MPEPRTTAAIHLRFISVASRSLSSRSIYAAGGMERNETGTFGGKSGSCSSWASCAGGGPAGGSERRPQRPGGELLVADALLLGLGLLAAGDGDDLFEDAEAD